MVEPRSLGEHLKRARLERHMTQKALAARLGVSPWTVLNWEKDRTEPPARIRPAIRCSLGWEAWPLGPAGTDFRR